MYEQGVLPIELAVYRLGDYVLASVLDQQVRDSCSRIFGILFEAVGDMHTIDDLVEYVHTDLPNEMDSKPDTSTEVSKNRLANLSALMIVRSWFSNPS